MSRRESQMAGGTGGTDLVESDGPASATDACLADDPRTGLSHTMASAAAVCLGCFCGNRPKQYTDPGSGSRRTLDSWTCSSPSLCVCPCLCICPCPCIRLCLCIDPCPPLSPDPGTFPHTIPFPASLTDRLCPSSLEAVWRAKVTGGQTRQP